LGAAAGALLIGFLWEQFGVTASLVVSTLGATVILLVHVVSLKGEGRKKWKQQP